MGEQHTSSRRNMATGLERSIVLNARDLMWEWAIFVNPFPDAITLTEAVRTCWKDARRELGFPNFANATPASNDQVSLEFVTGRTGPRKTRAPGPFPRPAPLNGLGRGVFFGIPCPCARSGPRPTHTPDGSPLKMCGNKQGPVQGMSAGGPRAGAGRGLPEKYPPGPV